MLTLLDDALSVHSNPEAGRDAYEPGDADRVWWASVSSGEAEDGPLSDAAWLDGEAEARAEKAHPALYTTAGLVRDTLRAAASACRTSPGKSARSAAAFRRARLDDARLPVTPRRSALAAELDHAAAWYLHLDTDAAAWAAWNLLFVADLADAMGSATAEDYLYDEAAWRAAMLDACDVPGLDLFGDR